MIYYSRKSTKGIAGFGKYSPVIDDANFSLVLSILPSRYVLAGEFNCTFVQRVTESHFMRELNLVDTVG